MSAPASYFAAPERIAALQSELASWMGTPFALRGAVKGQGVDCCTLCGEVMRTLGVIQGYSFPPYSIDYAKHHTQSLVLAWLDASPRFARLPTGEPPVAGDIACFTFGKCVHHCAVMLDAKRMIHAIERRAVVQSEMDDSTWSSRLTCFYRPLPAS